MNGLSRIKILREKKDMTQKELGDAVGISRQAIQKYESGDSKISTDNLQIIAEYFGVSPAYLMGWIDTENPEDEKENKAVNTIAAHMDGINPTEEELKQITDYIDFVFRDAFKK